MAKENKKEKTDLKQPEHAMSGFQFGNSGLYDTSFVKHGQIQATYPSNNAAVNVAPGEE